MNLLEEVRAVIEDSLEPVPIGSNAAVQPYLYRVSLWAVSPARQCGLDTNLASVTPLRQGIRMRYLGGNICLERYL